MPQVRALDFGRAFYLTSNFEQAAKWARTSVLRRNDGVATVSSFELDESMLSRLNVLRFDAPNVEWLRFVARNRAEQIDDSACDVVIGPVANDNTMPVLNLYFKGAYSEERPVCHEDRECPGMPFVQGGSRCMKRTSPEVLDYYDEEVVRRIVEKYGYGEREALELFLRSKTYQMMANPDMAMWQFGPEGIFNIWESEKITGSPQRSAYLRMD